MEGPPDQNFTLLGDDGYIIGRFATPVQDLPGYDFHVGTVQPPGTPIFGTFCAYGATNPQGPFTLVHSAYVDANACDATLKTTSYCSYIPSTAPACPSGEFCFHFDLHWFYTRLRSMQGVPEPGKMEYLLIVNSLDHTPYLKADFAIGPIDNSQSCINRNLGQHNYQVNDVAYPACPNNGYYPGPTRGNVLIDPPSGFVFEFNDTSQRFGYPMWKLWVEADDGTNGPEPVTCCLFDAPADTHADPISEWTWDFSSDPNAVSPNPDYPWPYDLPESPETEFWPQQRNQPFATMPIQNPNDHNRTHHYNSPGIFPACLSVHTADQIITDPPNPGEPMPTYYQGVWRQSDPPNSDPFLPGAGQYVTPPEDHVAPRSPVMYCKPVTVWNVAPLAQFIYSPEWANPSLFHFYDNSTDPDWVMPEGGHPNAMVPHYNAPLCWDCPSDGIQLREWVFEARPFNEIGATQSGKCMLGLCQFTTTVDGDMRWDFVSRPMVTWSWDPTADADGDGVQIEAADDCSAVEDQGWCGMLAGYNPTNNKTLLHAQTGIFTADDVGATVSGVGVPEGTVIISYLGPQDVKVSKVLPPSYGTLLTPKFPINIALSWPYQSETEGPIYEYMRPGDYMPRLRLCDHDHRVTKGPTIYGGLSTVHGDPKDVIWGDMDGNGIADTDPGVRLDADFVAAAPGITGTLPPGTDHWQGTSEHACSVIVKPLNIPNHAPHVAVPPNFVVAPNTEITFTAHTTDADRGQTITLRLCPQQGLPNGMVFNAVTKDGQELSQVFTWRTPRHTGMYGPVCFEATDGIHVTRVLTHIFVAEQSTDTDLDGVIDLADNCPGTPNGDQGDADRDGLGDACEMEPVVFAVAPPKEILPDLGEDQDEDGASDASDNCPALANRDQADRDGDSLGDMCDLDADGDGIANGSDDCPLDPDPKQDGAPCAASAFEVAKLPGMPLKQQAEPDTAPEAIWAIMLGTGLSVIAMAAVLVPLLLFALRRHKVEGDEGDGNDEKKE